MSLTLPSRRLMLMALAALLVVAALAWGFRSPPQLVDSTEVTQGPFRVTIENEGRTRFADRYQVTAPIAGHLARVILEPGDAIAPGDPLFHIYPLHSAPLDTRTRLQAEAVVARTEAALSATMTRAEAEQVRADLAATELARIQRLVERGHASQDDLDRARAEARQSQALLRSAQFAVDVARHERDTARAALTIGGPDRDASPVTVHSPVTGVVLRKLRESEGVIQPGEVVLSLGNPASLEVEVDVLSADAVRLAPGQRVELERWGGDEQLTGLVRRVEPAAFTRVSALGVDEQRVWVIVGLESGSPDNLGDGYRVDARFLLWEGDDVLQLPSAALFREGDDWFVYRISNGTAERTPVQPGRRAGLQRELLSGLAPGELVILHPPTGLSDGDRVRLR